MAFRLRLPKIDVPPPVSVVPVTRSSGVGPPSGKNPTTRTSGVGPPAPATANNQGGFRSHQITKGRITSVRTRTFREFMFNPTEISRTDGWAWGHHGVPGVSHPVISGGHGKGRMITFTVYLDGDRGRSDKRQRFPNTDAVGDSSAQPLDVTDDINWYRQFTYPVPVQANSLRDRGPSRIILSFGPLFPGVECVVHDVNTQVVQWTPFLEPQRATIQLHLEEFVRQSIPSTDIFFDTQSSTPFNTPLGDSVGDFPVTNNGNLGVG